MRILMVAHSNATWTPYFARFFMARGDVVKLVSVSPDVIDGIDMEFVGVEPFDQFKNKHMFFTSVFRLRRIIRRFEPDLAFAVYLVSNGLSAALAWRGPLAVAGVGGDVLNHEGRQGWRLWLREASIKYVCRRAQLINVVSEQLGEELIRLGVPASKLVLIPFGVDTAAFSPDPSMPRPQATRFICTRKHQPIYDIATIIRALAKLKAAGRSFHCTFTSDGHLREAHEAQVREAGLDEYVTFTGYLGHGELPELLRQSDIYVSASRMDGTSVSLLEGLAAGLLPVVPRITANLPWVKHGQTGLLFECGQADDLAGALALAMDDEALRRRAFEANRSRVDRDANMQRNMERLAEHLERIALPQGRCCG